jgi:hypothetical protein
MNLRLLYTRYALILLIVLMIIAGTVTGFASAREPQKSGGEATGVVSGYMVSNVTYTLNQTDPTILESVRFTLDQDGSESMPSRVDVRFDHSTSTWYRCNLGIPPNWECNTSGEYLHVADLNQLEVVAGN